MLFTAIAQQREVRGAGQSRATTAAEPVLGEKPGGTISLSISVGHADVSIVDHTPEELANLTLTGLRLEWASGIGPEGTFASFRLSVQNLQLDDQLPYSRCCRATTFPRAAKTRSEMLALYDGNKYLNTLPLKSQLSKLTAGFLWGWRAQTRRCAPARRPTWRRRRRRCSSSPS